MFSALPMLAARSLRRLGVVLALLGSLGGLALVDARPAAAALVHGQTVSFESQNFPGRYIRHHYWLGELTPLATELDRNDATFIVHSPGLTRAPGTVSLESANIRGHYLRHQDFRIRLAAPDPSQLFKDDATFFPEQLPNNELRFKSVNIHDHYIRHENYHLRISRHDGKPWFPSDSTWRQKPAANTPGLCPGADTPLGPNTLAVGEAAITCLTNEERKKAGLRGLTVNATLTGTARAHSGDMVQRRYFTHDSPEGRTPCQRMTAAGYPWCASYPENIRWRWDDQRGVTARHFMYDPAEPTKGWMQSPPHKAAILNPGATEIGVGLVAGNPDRTQPAGVGFTGTQNFGSR